MTYLLAVWRLILHVYRSLTAVTLYRNVVAEADHHPLPEIDTGAGRVIALPLEAFPRPELVQLGTTFSVESYDSPIPVELVHDEAADEPDPDDPIPPDRLPIVIAAVEQPKLPPAPSLAPLEVGSDGWLVGDNVVKVPTKRKGYRWRGIGGRPSGCLWHWTATAHGTALAMVKRCVEPAGPGERAAWVHFWVEHDGTIYQSGALTAGAPHAGAPSSARVRIVEGELKIVPRKESSLSVNSFLVGTEVVCLGEMRLMRPGSTKSSAWVKATEGDTGAKWIAWPFRNDGKTGPSCDASEIVDGIDNQGIRRHYQRFTDRQLEAIERLSRAFRARFAWGDKAMSWGHVDVDPTRKSDPGPFFQHTQYPAILERMRAR